VPGVVLLANPESGTGDAAGVESLVRAHAEGVRSFTLDQLEEAARVDAERYVVAGGDGSIGCVAKLAADSGVPLGVVPVGTANDFARFLGLPLDSSEAAVLAAEGDVTRRLDLAHARGPEIGDRPFLNAASVGLSPVAARKAHGLKRVLGSPAYALGAVRAGLTARPLPCVVRADGRRAWNGKAWQVTVASTGAFGGGAEVEADPGDGRLDAIVIEAGSRPALILRAYGLRAGTVTSQRGVHRSTVATIELDVPPGTPYNIDGELVTGGPARFEVERQVVPVVMG
jgi:diacylglycerol kinase (ATP)